jgi:hypothetical protein
LVFKYEGLLYVVALPLPSLHVHVVRSLFLFRHAVRSININNNVNIRYTNRYSLSPLLSFSCNTMPSKPSRRTIFSTIFTKPFSQSHYHKDILTANVPFHSLLLHSLLPFIFSHSLPISTILYYHSLPFSTIIYYYLLLSTIIYYYLPFSTILYHSLPFSTILYYILQPFYNSLPVPLLSVTFLGTFIIFSE